MQQCKVAPLSPEGVKRYAHPTEEHQFDAMRKVAEYDAAGKAIAEHNGTNGVVVMDYLFGRADDSQGCERGDAVLLERPVECEGNSRLFVESGGGVEPVRGVPE